jgi:hypothetical protein
MPRDLVYGSPLRQGLGYPDLYVWQGITKELFDINYELLCLETGFMFPLEKSYPKYGKLSTHCYLRGLWESTDMYDIRLCGPSNPAVSTCTNDILIMEHMGQVLEGEELMWFNWCRIYLKVLWVSEICTADGKYIDWYATKGEINPTKTTRWKWPVQGLPPKNAWDCWKKGISTLGSCKGFSPE